ncbi:MAG TPA: isoprenylcysteine carboxylmethyltransferase family protein [Gemmatimonadales bacterium]|nr:isoprenylcysteine carboxylmethyltransferase family protein [Gemmatimonadales bacterium]
MTLELIIGIIIPTLWIAWLVYWWYSARNVKPTRVREPLHSQLQHRVPLMLAAFLLAAPRWVPGVLTRRFLPAGPVFPILGTIMLAAGLGFSVWARRHLGRNWSAQVVVKEDHALVRSGPYRYLRHPIYTGLLLAFLGMVVTIGELRAILAFAFALLAFARKSRAEEDRMRETFPEYERYRQDTAALIPFVY